jgi:tRNA threonylcarbamoyladenosine biosynthesis protein TsaB
MSGLTLAIEISNPSSGPRGQTTVGGRTVLAGPGVALAGAGEPDSELLSDRARHDDDLMPAIDRLFRRAGAGPRDLATVAVSVGPGGFTSLRIAIATAKLLALATGAKTVAVPSALVAAFLVAPQGPTLVCLASKGETTFGTLLPDGPDRFARAQTLGLLDAAALASVGCDAVIADRFLPDSVRRVITAPVLEPVFAAASLIRLAGRVAPTDPVALAPSYPRPPEAVTLWQARHPRS